MSGCRERFSSVTRRDPQQLSSISTISLNSSLGPYTKSKSINCAMCARGMCSTEL